MGYRNREIESKLIVSNPEIGLDRVNQILNDVFGGEKERMLFGSSLDIYWPLGQEVAADFLRVRERDRSVQVTVKGKDRDTNLNRMEREFLTTDSLATVIGVFTAALGKPTGCVGKTYYVYFLGKVDTVCCYTITEPVGFDRVIVEVEAHSQNRMLQLEAKVLEEFSRRDIQIERAPGSLYEMFVLREVLSNV